MKVLESVRDEDPAAPPAAPEAPPEEFPAGDRFGRMERHFYEMREAFRRVQEVIDTFGVSHVSELDPDRRQIIIVYLEGALERIESDRP